jgi:non-heme chloroperoxidase
MADHTAIDWRPMLRQIKAPCLNIVGRHSAVFPWWGTEAVGKLLPNSHTVYFEGANHWMYLEEPGKFNSLVAAFALHGFPGIAKYLHM